VNWVDYALLVLVALSGIHGLRLGAAMQVLSFGGFWLGLFVGVLIAPPLADLAKAKGEQALIAVVVVFGMAVILGGVGRLLGAHSSSALQRVRLGPIDSAFGVAVAVFATLVAAWLAASLLANSRFQTLASAMDESRIVRAMDRLLPPLPTLFNRIQSLLSSEGFPLVFNGLPPQLSAPVLPPSTSAVGQAVIDAEPSTVQIVGSGCGVIQEGSGFVVASGYVVTNAHVVAGIPQPYVVDASGRHAATAMLFDPQLDLAVLKVPGLTDPPIHLDTNVVGRGVTGVVLGFPEGGPFKYRPAAVDAAFEANGLDIYGQQQTTREVYQLNALVQPGNSGGPLVASGDSSQGIPDGTVIGVVFARSTTNSNVGYALAMRAVGVDIQAGEASTRPSGTGQCASS
jgi:S1-C subfamily serine protease